MTQYGNITHVIYDLDGLLLDTECFYTQVTQTIAGRFGKAFDWSVKSKMMGKKGPDSARILTETLELPITPEEYLQERERLLENLFPEAEPMPGAVALTRHLYRHGIPQAIATSSERRFYELKTSRHKEWFAIFDCCVIGDDAEVKRGKPAPDIFLLAASRLKAPTEQSLVFEDAPAGVEAARAAGMYVIAVPDPNMSHRDYPGAHQILHTLEEFDPVPWGLPALEQGRG